MEVGSPAVTNVPLWCGMLLMEEAMHTATGYLWENSGPSAQFCCEPKTALKTKLYPRKKQNFCTKDVIFSKVLYKVTFPWYPRRILTLFICVWGEGQTELGNRPYQGLPQRGALVPLGQEARPAEGSALISQWPLTPTHASLLLLALFRNTLLEIVNYL